MGEPRPRDVPVILVVDDEPMLRLLIRLTLEALRVRVVEAEDVASGLSIARDERPELVILDRGLPDGDGLEVCRQLRADPATSDVAIVILSARATPEDRAQGLAAGADEYWFKPFRPGELRAFLMAKFGW